MDRSELRFRAAATLRKTVDRVRTSFTAPAWDRSDLSLSGPAMRAVRGCLARADWMAAHAGLAQHFQTRARRFPLHPPELPGVVARVREQFPHTSTTVADRVLAGRYDVLGYSNVDAGVTPDWHRDPVHGRRAPLLFWDRVPYLDPASGDHKITWELNRHQHWLVLGRAYQLTRDRRYYDAFVQQLESWMQSNPPLLGTNWASMLELAFRSLSWLWALHFFADAASPGDEHPWIVDLLLGVDRQLLHVEHNLSRYFSPNTHLTGEALGLYVAGQVLPELKDSQRRAAAGREVLLAEAGRQILADGGHAERSAHYHRYSTDFYLLALNIARITGDGEAPRFESAARRQAEYLRTIADDRGRLPMIGDDDGGQLFPIGRRDPADACDSLAHAAVLLNDPALALSTAPEETYWFCANHDPERLTPAGDPWPSRQLSASGYCVSRNERGDHLVFDCGPHGYLNGGHAHADALSIVLTVGGRRVLVDPGTATYTMDPAVRDRFRSTAMHNTVVVNGQGQSQPRGPFHWRTATDAECTAWESRPEGDFAEGRHGGYGAVTHVRRVSALHGIGWIVIDELTGPGLAEVTALWHLDPAWSVRARSSSCVELVHGDGTRLGLASSAELRRIHDNGLDAISPAYGRIEPAPCLATVIVGEGPVSVATFIAAERTWLPVRVRRGHDGAFTIETDGGIITIDPGSAGRPAIHINAGLASSLHD